MAHFSLVVPYDRPPNHVPRRDLVLGAADSLLLEVSIVQYDNPAALALELSGGIGGPGLRMAVWPVDYCPRSWDYGALWPAPGSIIWSGDGTISTCGPGTFDIEVPVGALASLPRRCAYGLQLDWDHGAGSDLLCIGIMHIRRVQFSSSVAPTAITTDSNSAITDDSSAILVA